MFDAYPEGSNLTILKCDYIYPMKDPKTEKYTSGSLTIVAKDNNTGEKIMETITNPGYTYYKLTPDIIKKRMIDYNLEYIEKEHVVPVTAAYKDIYKSIAMNSNNMDFYNACINQGRRRDLNKLQLCKNILFSDMNIEDYYRFLFSKKYKNEVVPVSKVFFDIEVDTIDMMGDFPEPGECPVNAVSIVDQSNSRIFVLLLRNENNPLIKKFEDDNKEEQINRLKATMTDAVGGEKAFNNNGLDKFGYRFLFYDDEIELIYSVFAIINNIKPDFVLAWNMAFDIPYIIQRIKNLGFDPKDIMCSPDFKEKICKYVVDDKDTNGETKVLAERGDFAAISSYSEYIDQMIQFASRRKGQSAYVSFKLNDIGEQECGAKKLDYSHITTNISKFPYLDYETFVFYNIIDTIVQVCIENKTGDIDFLFNRSLTCNTRYRKAYRQTVYLVNRIISEYYDMGYIMGNNKNKFNEKPKSKFPGAFVADPKKISDNPKIKINGHPLPILNNLDDYDFARLYPSMLQEFNMSSETLVGKLQIAEKIYEFENKSRDTKFSREGEFLEDFSSKNYIEFCQRWLKLAGYEEMIDDIIEYFTTVQAPMFNIPVYDSNGLVNPIIKNNKELATVTPFYHISEETLIKPYYTVKAQNKDISRRLEDEYIKFKGYNFK